MNYHSPAKSWDILSNLDKSIFIITISFFLSKKPHLFVRSYNFTNNYFSISVGLLTAQITIITTRVTTAYLP